LVDRMATELGSRAEVMTAMLAEFFTSPEALAAVHEQGTALAELVADIVARGQERGEFHTRVDARIAAASFLATATAILSGQVFHQWGLAETEIRRQFLHLTLHGLAPS